MRKIIYTVESVTSGHPDKVCDQISDAILDAYLAQDKFSRVAMETFGSHNLLVIGGEVTSQAKINSEEIASNLYKKIGYDDSLKIITKFLGFSIELSQNLLHLDSETKIRLLPNLNLIIVKSNSKTEEKSIDSFPTDVIINVLDYIVPKIVELVRLEKLQLLNSINFLRAANDDLKKIDNIGQLELNSTPVI